MDVKELVSFSGRINRKQFISRSIVIYAFLIVAILLFYEPINPYKGMEQLIPLAPLLVIAWGGLLIMYANINKRFHDIGKSGKWTIVVFVASSVTIIYIIAMLYLMKKKEYQKKTNMANAQNNCIFAPS